MIGENGFELTIFIASIVIVVALWVILIYMYAASRKKKKNAATADTKNGENNKVMKAINIKEVPLETLFTDKNFATVVAKALQVPPNQSIKEDVFLSIKELNAEYANISSLDGIGKLKNLERLNVSNNAIQKLPSEMSGLDKLEKLQVAYNQLSDSIQVIKDNKELKSIDLSGNTVKELNSDIFGLPKLEELIVVNGAISAIPKEIDQAKNLQHLNLSHNDIEQLPIELGNLEKLKQCNFSYNKIKEIPEELANLAALEEFDISRNSIPGVSSKTPGQINLQSVLLPTTGENNLEENNDKGESDMSKLVNTYIDLTSSNDNLLADLKELENFEQEKNESRLAEADFNMNSIDSSGQEEPEVTVTFANQAEKKLRAPKKKKNAFIAVGAAVGSVAVVGASVFVYLLKNRKR